MHKKTYSPWRPFPLFVVISWFYMPEIYFWFESRGMQHDFITGKIVMPMILTSFELLNSVQSWIGTIVMLAISIGVMTWGKFNFLGKVKGRYFDVYRKVDDLENQRRSMNVDLDKIRSAVREVYSKHLKLEENVKALTGLCPDEQAGREDLSKSFNQEH